ncbi:MAG: DUF488 family protein [Lactimicrobium sp.]|jgi:uncharacterized protein YeaO (DUF488 family)|uniref:DUF488 domain-containing protein n=1 Tax=Lactimicrobium sp. TaxID=2563780 RepID=UPI002F35125E
MGVLQVKRIYLAPEETDGCRILVDKLWPRGISKEKAMLFYWAKEAAPSNELRKQFHADHDFDAFRTAYLKELDDNAAALDLLAVVKQHLANENVTLVFGSKDEAHNNAPVLAAWLQSKLD